MVKSHIRKNRVNFVLTDRELEILKKRAEEKQLTVSEYIRHETVDKVEVK